VASVYLSLGSNVEPQRHLAAAVAALRQRFGKVLLSPVYRTPAVGFQGADFLNAAARLHTDMAPEVLNQWLHDLEDQQGRRRDVPRYWSRTLDIDMLLYDDRVLIGDGHLELPRAELAGEAFVLKPMVDIAPDLVHPTLGRTLAALWADFPPAPQDLHPTRIKPFEDNGETGLR
jgi:2-amino-4-hydroxy-6-hydroxymethyldihydropteridine diphosphokinase